MDKKKLKKILDDYGSPSDRMDVLERSLDKRLSEVEARKPVNKTEIVKEIIKEPIEITPTEIKTKLAELPVKDRWFDWGHLKNIPAEVFKKGEDGLISWGNPFTVSEIDGSPSVSNVTGLIFSNGAVTDNGDGTVTVAASAETLAQTLALGNLTGGIDIVLSDGDVITGSGGQMMIDFTNDGAIALTTDGGGFTTPYLTINPTTLSLAGLGTGGIDFFLGSIQISHATLIQFNSAPVRFNALTASTVPYLAANKDLTSSAVTPTELGYLSGVSSAIQTQLDAKLDDSQASVFGLSLLDDANATAVLTTLGIDTDLLTLSIGASASVSGTNTGDQDLSGLVPYTGATTNVDLGSRTLTVETILGSAANGLILQVPDDASPQTLQLIGANATGGSGGSGGSVSIDCGIGDGAGTGGTFGFNAGAGGETGNGGSFGLFGGAGGSTSGNGGAVDLTAGAALGDGNGGDVNLTAGSVNGVGTGGKISFRTGSSDRRGIFDFDALATTNKTFTFPNATGTIVLHDLAQTLTNKTIALGSNTVSGTIAQFNTAVTDADFATLAGVEELDNKTLDSSVGKGTWTASGTWTLPAITLGGNVTFAENTGLVLDSALSADGKYCGIVRAGTAGATLAFGDLVYLAAADSRWELADADAASTSGDVILGMCVLAAAADGDPTTILFYGLIRADTAFPALTVGAPAYVGTTAGDIQTAQPSGTDDVIRRVGFAWTADELFFNPSNDYITHV